MSVLKPDPLIIQEISKPLVGELDFIAPSADDNLIDLVEVLEEIDENKAAAKLNEISIIDNKGGRIYF